MTAPQEPSETDSTVARLRVPPHSVEAEQSLLGGLLQDSTTLGRVSDILAPTDFYRHEHNTIFTAIASMAAAGLPVDVITVFEQLEGSTTDYGGMAYLHALITSVPTAANIRRYAEIIVERSTLRRLIGLSDEIATAAYRGLAPDRVLDDAKVALARVEIEAKLGTGRRVPLLALAELREQSHSVRWLIKHVMPADSIGMIFGASGAFKSFIAIDAALHVAHGLPWMGRRTTQGPVLYIAGEGGSGLWKRVAAWHRQRHISWQDTPLRVVPLPLDLQADAWRVVESAHAIGMTPAMVVIDTLSQTYNGEENSANEMAAYLRELGLRFRQLWQCAVVLIHHTGHLATERPRGSSAIRSNLDWMFGTFRDEKEMLATLTCAKQKDGEPFDDATFQLLPHDLGTDEDGDHVTSLVARHLSSAEDVEQAMETEGKAGRGGRNLMLLSLAQNGMREAELRKAFYDDSGLDDVEARKKAYQRARLWAIKKGFIDIAQGRVITLKTGPKA